MGTREIDFGSQVMLRDLLKHFLFNSDASLSKEQLVRFLWSEDYDPLRHDNRVYVTIRRLRLLVDSKIGPTLILREKTGYRIHPEWLPQPLRQETK